MTRRRHFGTGPGLWAWLGIGLLCVASAASAAKDEATIAKLIEQLGANDYKVRQQAQKRLVEIGQPAIPQLTKALKSDDAEVQQRAEKALVEIRKGAYGRASDAIAKQIIWKIETSGTLTGPPAASAGRLVYLSQAGVRRAVDAAEGREAWKADATPARGYAVAGGTVYSVDKDGTLQARDAKTGKAVDGFAGPKVQGTPVVAGGVIYVVAGPEKLLALDAKTGAKKWEAELSEKVTSPAAPVIGGGRLYVPVGQGGLAAYECRSGKRKWEALEIKGEIDCLAYSDGVLLTRSQSGLHGFDPAKGKVLWTRSVPVNNVAGGLFVFQARQVININGRKIVFSNSSDRARRSMAIVDGVIYVSGGDHLTAVDVKKGREKWAHKMATKAAGGADQVNTTVVLQGAGNAQIQMVVGGTGIGSGSAGLTAPAVAGGVAYVGGGEGLHALDLKTRQELWRLKTGDSVVGVPVVIDGVLYFVTAPGMRGGMMIVRGGQRIQKGAKLHALRLKAKR